MVINENIKQPDLNVWKYGWSPLTYLPNWWRNIRNAFKCIKRAWQRTTLGYCDIDIWELNCFYMSLFYSTLNKLADDCFGYPGVEPWETSEKWTEYLKEMAMYFYKANEDNEYYINEFDDMVFEDLHDNEPDKKIFEKWRKTNIEIADQSNSDLHKGLDMLRESFWKLWD